MNKKILKIASAISALNFTAPIVANATTYRSVYTNSTGTNHPRTMVIGTTSSNPAAILAQLRTNRKLGRTTILQSTSSISQGVQIIQPYNPPGSSKIHYRHVDFIH